MHQNPQRDWVTKRRGPLPPGNDFRTKTQLRENDRSASRRVRSPIAGPRDRHVEKEVSAMWLVRVALDRPYTFVVLALLVLIMSAVAISTTPTAIFPSIDIPV